MIATVQNYLALAALGQGDRGAARLHCTEALAIARELGNKREIAVASNALAQLDRLDGQFDAAEPLYRQVVELAHELADREFAAIGILGLAMVAICRSAAEQASDLLRDVLVIADETGSKPAGQSALEVAAGLAALRNDWERSARFYGVAEAQTLRTGIRRDPADEAFLRAVARTDARGGRRTAGSRRLKPRAALCASTRRWRKCAHGSPPGTDRGQDSSRGVCANRLANRSADEPGISVTQNVSLLRCTVQCVVVDDLGLSRSSSCARSSSSSVLP